MKVTPEIEITNEDNMELMARYEDNYFDLAIVDPPFGIGEDGGKNRRGKSKHEKKKWDLVPPSQEYFEELKRISKNQIIWGANYMIDKIKIPSMGWIAWDKKLDNSDFSDFELAYTSFKRAAKIFRYSKNGGSRTPGALADIIHPCQKPIKLYEWLLQHYATPGQKVLDTHCGSGSIAIALDRMNKIEGMGLTLVACELDKDYYESSIKRIKTQINWIPIFQEKPEPPEQKILEL